MKTVQQVVRELIDGLRDGSIVLEQPPPAVSEEPLWALFHRLWSKDVGTPGYNKKDWVELERLILQKGK